jgi:hypothetical protein
MENPYQVSMMCSERLGQEVGGNETPDFIITTLYCMGRSFISQQQSTLRVKDAGTPCDKIPVPHIERYDNCEDPPICLYLVDCNAIKVPPDLVPTLIKYFVALCIVTTSISYCDLVFVVLWKEVKYILHITHARQTPVSSVKRW